MKKIFILLFICSAAISLNAQVLMQWQKCFGGSGDERASDIISTTDGGYAIIGSTSSNDGDVSGNHNISDSISDIWVIKIDSQANIQWQKCLGGSGYDVASSIIQTTDGGYAIAGGTRSNDGDVSGNHGYTDYWIVKLDSQGNIQWQKCFGGSNTDYAGSIEITDDGGYIVAGGSYSNDGEVYGSHGDLDIWVVKLDSLGNIQWQKCFGGSGKDGASDIICTTDGGYFIAGSTLSNDGDVSGNHSSNLDCWGVKLDSLGNIIWQKCLGGTNDDCAYSIIQNNDDSYIMVGWTESNDGDVNGNHANWNADFWVVKLDQNGDLQWQKCYGGSSGEMAESVIHTNNSGYALAGYSCSIDGDVCGVHIGSDYWVVNIDQQGNINWKKSMGGTSPQDVAMSIIQTANRNYVVAGYVWSNDGDVTGNHGMGDIWVVNLIEPNISGKVFHDINENGVLDIGEQGAAGQMVKLEPGPQYTITNNEGNYYFYTDIGNAIVSYLPFAHWHPTSTSIYNVSIDSAGQKIDTLDIGIRCRVNVHDVSVYITGSPTRAGFGTHYWLTYKNWGTVTANGTIEFQYDSLLTYNTSTHTPVSHIGNTLTFAYDTLGPGVQRMLRVDFMVPGVQNLGDTLHSYAMITPLVPDTFITNNYDTLQQIITGSYDPNDKTVSPAGYEQWGFVEHGQRLTYTIRFQNTGTDTAFTVVIRDTLDADLDIETFVVETNSHPVTWQLHNGNELFFSFQNIMLPDSNVNEPGSNGFIRYSISPKAGLADGTTASNTSYIFFDYNPAVVTNTTLNTFVTNIPFAIPENERKTFVNAYPNPSQENIYINLPEFTRKVQVYNISGEMVKEVIPQKPVAEINVQGLPAGVYAVRIYYSGGVVTTKFVKE